MSKKFSLEAKLAKNRARGQRKDADLEAQIVRDYTSEEGIGYRALAARHHVGLGTVMRIIRRAGGTVGTAGAGPSAAKPDRARELLREALELLDTRSGKRKLLGERIRSELGIGERG